MQKWHGCRSGCRFMDGHWARAASTHHCRDLLGHPFNHGCVPRPGRRWFLRLCRLGKQLQHFAHCESRKWKRSADPDLLGESGLHAHLRFLPHACAIPMGRCHAAARSRGGRLHKHKLRALAGVRVDIFSRNLCCVAAGLRSGLSLSLHCLDARHLSVPSRHICSSKCSMKKHSASKGHPDLPYCACVDAGCLCLMCGISGTHPISSAGCFALLV